MTQPTKPAQHTPTPWVAVHDKKQSRISPKWGQFRLATLESDGRHADGDFICRAVNCHAELLEACECAFAALDFTKKQGDAHDWEALEPLHEAYAKTRTAIAKAQGRAE